jgi:catechol 2,3-dioxygenase-like lactoylglutathione lyase family enzyme
MHAPLKRLSLINLFVEDLPAAKAFYQDIFELEWAFGDDYAAAYKLGDTLINLLTIPAAREQLAPARVAGPDTGSRVQFAVVVDDIDGRCAVLAAKGIALINGPEDKPWGMRTACFADPAGHIWEFAQPVGGQE